MEASSNSLHNNQGNGGNMRTIVRLFLLFYIPFAIILTCLLYSVLKIHTLFAIDVLQSEALAHIYSSQLGQVFDVQKSLPIQPSLDLFSLYYSSFTSLNLPLTSNPVNHLIPITVLPPENFAHRTFILGIYFVSLLLLGILVFYWAAILASRKKLYQTIRDSEFRFREIASAIGEGVYAINDEGYIIYSNPEATRLLGRSQEELFNKNAHTLFHSHANGIGAFNPHCNLNKTSRSNFPYHSDDELFRNKNGDIFPVEIHSVPLLRDTKIVGYVVAFQDISMRKQSQCKIHQLAYYDHLTNLANRQLLLDRLKQSLDQAKRYQRSLAVMFLDLDKFKLINDRLGHDIGDQLLKHVALRLTDIVRGGDTVARLGGDEFVIILTEITYPQAAESVATKMLKIIENSVNIDVHKLYITASIGIATYPQDGSDAVTLLKKADLAMYAAKDAGRNQFQFFSSDFLIHNR